MTLVFGIDLSGDASRWSPLCSRPNVWVCRGRQERSDLIVEQVLPVQHARNNLLQQLPHFSDPTRGGAHGWSGHLWGIGEAGFLRPAGIACVGADNARSRPGTPLSMLACSRLRGSVPIPRVRSPQPG
jgi:hypothetical protein